MCQRRVLMRRSCTGKSLGSAGSPPSMSATPRWKRRKLKVSARTKMEAKAKMQQLLRNRDDGHVFGGQTYTVRDAVESWLALVSLDARRRRWSIGPSLHAG